MATKLNTFRNAPNTLVPRNSLLSINIITRDLTWNVLNAVFRTTISSMWLANKAHPVYHVHKKVIGFAKNHLLWVQHPDKGQRFLLSCFFLQRKTILTRDQTTRIFYQMWYLKISQPWIRHLLSSGTPCQLVWQGLNLPSFLMNLYGVTKSVRKPSSRGVTTIAAYSPTRLSLIRRKNALRFRVSGNLAKGEACNLS